MKLLEEFITDTRISIMPDEPFAADDPDSPREAPATQAPQSADYSFDRAQIEAVVITAETNDDEAVYATGSAGSATPSAEEDVQFLVAIEQSDVRWTVQRPFQSFERLHQYFENSDPPLHGELQDFLPSARPTTAGEHEQCAAEMQRYFEKALDGYKRIHQREFARVVSPKEAVGQLRGMEGRLAISRTARPGFFFPPQSRWCRLEVFDEDAASAIKAAVDLGARAEAAEQSGEPEAVARSVHMYLEAKRRLLPRLQECADEEEQVELSQRVARWVQAADRLTDARPGFIPRRNDLCMGKCFSWFESSEEQRAPAVSAVLPACSEQPDGPKMAVTRGSPPEDWAIQTMDLPSCYVRTERGNFRLMEIIDTASGRRVRCKADTTPSFALWLAGLRQLCKGRLSTAVRQQEFSLAGVPDLRSVVGTPGLVGAAETDYVTLNAFTPDHTWLAHPRRGSDSGLADLAPTPPPRQRRLSTDDEYLQELKDSFDMDGEQALREPQRRGIVPRLGRRTVSTGGPTEASHADIDDTIVMDFGSHSLKAGRARDEFPIAIVPSRHPDTQEPLVRGEALGEFWRVDWDGVEDLWQKLFEKQLRIDPSAHDFILTEPPDATVSGKQELAERLLEDWEIPRLAMRPQSELGMLAYGRTTGLAVSCGDRLSIMPYIDGFVLSEFRFDSDFGGRDVTREWQRLAGERYAIHADSIIPAIRAWKEAHSFALPLSERESERDGGAPAVVTRPDGSPLGFEARLKTGRAIEFDEEAWRAPEVLFSTNLHRTFDVIGLQGAVIHVVNQCPIDQRAQLLGGIELMGGTSCIEGLAPRLEAEVRAALQAAGSNAAVKVCTQRNRQFAPWMGGVRAPPHPPPHPLLLLTRVRCTCRRAWRRWLSPATTSAGSRWRMSR